MASDLRWLTLPSYAQKTLGNSKMVRKVKPLKVPCSQYMCVTVTLKTSIHGYHTLHGQHVKCLYDDEKEYSDNLWKESTNGGVDYKI